jgi:hypothetical protein
MGQSPARLSLNKSEYTPFQPHRTYGVVVNPAPKPEMKNRARAGRKEVNENWNWKRNWPKGLNEEPVVVVRVW